MNIRTEKISRGAVYYSDLQNLNNEAFPKEERIPIEDFIYFSENCEFMDFSAILDDDKLIGFYYALKRDHKFFICYFAIKKELRSKGYGSEVLKYLFSEYSDFVFALDMERTDVECKNLTQRKKREAFYLRNGFKKTGWQMLFNDVPLEVLSTDKDFNAQDFLLYFRELNRGLFPYKNFERVKRS